MKKDLADIRKHLAVPRSRMDLKDEEHVRVYNIASMDMWKSYFVEDTRIFEKADAYEVSYPESLSENDTLPAFKVMSGLSKHIVLQVTILDNEKKVSFSFSSFFIVCVFSRMK